MVIGNKKFGSMAWASATFGTRCIWQ